MINYSLHNNVALDFQNKSIEFFVTVCIFVEILICLYRINEQQHLINGNEFDLIFSTCILDFTGMFGGRQLMTSTI